MRKRLKRFVTASILLGLIAAPQLTAAGFPGRSARRAARIIPPAPPLAAASSERTGESVALSPPALTHSSPQPATPDDHALAEIARIRDAYGSVLKGSLLEAPLAPELQPPRTQDTQPAEPPRANHPDAFRTALRQIAVAETRTPAAPATQDLSAGNSRAEASSPDLALIVSLRSASRALDTKASDFEDARRFTDAERLRALAHQLRQEARTVENANERNRSP